MNARELYLKLKFDISKFMDQREASAVSHLILEHLCGLNRADILTNKSFTWDKAMEDQLTQYVKRLKNHVPVQYVLNEAEFYGRKFVVDENVLIPRQETEELVEMIIGEYKGQTPRILDIGTGSGCIAISLALALSRASISALDISPNSLKIARKNAKTLRARVNFFKYDLFQKIKEMNPFDVLVSNPPYISEEEKHLLPLNVSTQEPSHALFAGENGLAFYRRIGEVSQSWLSPGGKLFLEIHELKAKEVESILFKYDFNKIAVFYDLNHKQRFVTAIKSTKT